jgi:hypothetical protein
MTIPDVIVVVSGGNVQAVYASSETKIQLIDFDNLKEGDTFDPHFCSVPDGPPNGAGALEVIAEALERTARNRQNGLAECATPDHDHDQGRR